MNRRHFVLLVPVTLALVAAPGLAEARKRSLADHAKVDAERLALVRSARKQAAAAKLGYSPADRAAASTLTRKLSAEQRAAVGRLSEIFLRDAERAAAKRDKTMAVDADRLRPHVVATGSRDARALAAASLIDAARRAKQHTLDLANQLQQSADVDKQLREDIVQLRDIIADGHYPTSFTYHDPRVRTVSLQSREQAQRLLEDLEATLGALDDTSEKLQLELQMANDQRSQVMAILSSIIKRAQSTMESIIQNLK